MNDDWRVFLYPLGFLSTVAFGVRFIVQWIGSEIEGRSIVPRSFWQISLIGNTLLLVHSFIQLQYHVCIIQAGNAVISWRNLNLMYPPSEQVSFRSVLMLLASMLSLTTLAFAVHADSSWFRIPTAPWQDAAQEPLSFLWHIIGFTGFALFSSRFWVQWWNAEKQHESLLGPAFWWLSLSGAICSLVYFSVIHDLVNLVGPAVGMIPYVRNLMLIRKSEAAYES